MNNIEQTKAYFGVSKITSRVLNDLARRADYSVYMADKASVERLSAKKYRYGMYILVDPMGGERVKDSARDAAEYLDRVLTDLAVLDAKGIV